MDCEQARQLCQAQCDGELTARLEANLAAHLAACEACRGHQRQMAALLGGLEALRDETARLDFTAPPGRAGFTSAARFPLWQRWAGVGRIAAVVAIAVGAASMLSRQPPGTDREAGPSVVTRGSKSTEPATPAVVLAPPSARAERVGLPDGAGKEVRGLAWRDGTGPVPPAKLDAALDRRTLRRHGTVGRADAPLVKAIDVWRLRREHLRTFCPRCTIRPRTSCPVRHPDYLRRKR